MTRPVRPGLCSVTFRALSPAAVLDLAGKHGVEEIEWGGDVHVPDPAAAEDVARRSEEAGIACPSFGSYVRAGTEGAPAAFEVALATANALGARNIRVWAGRTSGPQADEATWRAVAGDLRAMADRAAREDVTVSVEYHRNTLTEEAADAARLMRDCDRPNLFSYWQPVPGRGRARWLEEIEMLRPWLGYLHAFHWLPAQPRDARRPLAEGAEDWAALFAAWQPAPGWPLGRTAFLEFVKDDEEKAFADDMAVLRRLASVAA
jgi:sugar phosphate isomerase/epimerase